MNMHGNLMLSNIRLPFLLGILMQKTRARSSRISTAKIKPTTVRIEEGLKEQATEFLDSVGLSLNSYLNLAVRQLVNQRKIPFEIVGRPEVPNEATRRAMVIAEAHELGILPDDSPSFDNVDELMTFLDED